MPKSALNYVLSLSLAGCSTAHYINEPKPAIIEQKDVILPTIEDCNYSNDEKLDLYKIMENVNISEKDCAKTVVAQEALRFLGKKAAEMDVSYGYGTTTRMVYDANKLIEEALKNPSFRRALVEADRNYDKKVDYKEAKTVADFLNY